MSQCYHQNGKTSKCCDDEKTVGSTFSKRVTSCRQVTCNISKEINAKNMKPSFVVKPKKTVKSASNISKPMAKLPLNCEKCGDVKQEYDVNKFKNHKLEKSNSEGSVKKSIQRYYKNENFNSAANSVQRFGSNFKKGAHLVEKINDDKLKCDKVTFTENLDTVYSNILELESSSSGDLEKEEDLKTLKDFREKNYFECHSMAKLAKIKHVKLTKHKCSYRFYLNERLFPVPIYSDYNNTVRCTECYLPMKFDQKNSKINIGNNENLNGTIQAKVSLGEENNQDLTIVLPVKDTLIVTEKRKDKVCKINDENFYFGVIKLSDFGNPLLNKTLPSDSLALRYQKGYREMAKREPYRYKKDEDFELISI